MDNLKFFCRTTLAFVFAFSIGLAQALTLDSEHSDTIQALVAKLEARHYEGLKYSDELSRAHWQEYIDALDPRRIYFTQSDIEQFKKYQLELDDQAKTGELRAAIEIFNAYQTRQIERLTSLTYDLRSQIDKLDFEAQEYLLLDPSEAPWPLNEESVLERWRLYLKNDVLNLKLAGKETEDIAATLLKRYQNQLKRAEQITSMDVFSIYANTLAALYDPHSSYFSPRRTENFNIEMSLSLEGIGAMLQQDGDYTKVNRIVPKGPADKQGELKPQDQIVGVAQGVDGEMVDVIGWRLDEVVDLIRGPKESLVRLEVIPAEALASGERKEIKIVRNEVKLEEQAAQSKVIELDRDGNLFRLGVIDLPTFYIDFDAANRGDPDYRSTTRDVSRLLEELQAQKIDAVVLDLRNNGGGSLREANDLTSLFIEYGPTVQIRHSSDQIWRDGKRRKGTYYDGPLGVIINRMSASASEIFAGAIQDYGRGLIIGTQSYGKGTVQTLLPLPAGQLKVTESKFYRISGDSTQHRGVMPDVTLPSLYDPAELGESALDHALEWDQIKPVRHTKYGDFQSLVPKLISSSQNRQMSVPQLVLLQEQVSLSRENDDMDRLSLNYETRKKEREARNSRWLAIENKRRALEGEDLLASVEDMDQEDEDDAADTAANTDVINPDKDALLRESLEVMIDALVYDNTLSIAGKVSGL